MARPLRHHPVVQRPLVLEVTCRTIQGRFLLTPSEKVNQIILGILGRALGLYKGILLIDFTFLSNHYHFQLIAENEEQLSRFMGYVNGMLARKIAAKIHNWKAKTWGRRYTSIPILDEKQMVRKLHYIYSQSFHHNLVKNPENWPGVSTLNTRLHNKKLIGIWYNETAMSAARKRGDIVAPEDYATTYEIKLAPLPCWSDLSESEYREKIVDILVDIALEPQSRWESKKGKPFGVKAILEQNPHKVPFKMSFKKAPKCHASNRDDKHAYEQRLRKIRIAYDKCVERLYNGEYDVDFPDYCFPPARLFVTPERRNNRKATVLSTFF